jgi:hypothetical protein
MSYVFSFNGATSSLNSYFPENIDVSEGNWVMGLTGFEAYNTVPNIDQSNDTFYYYEPRTEEPKKFKLQHGAYNIEDLEDAIKQQLPADVEFQLVDNPNTQQCIILSNAKIDFSRSNTLRELLGFKQKVLDAGVSHTSENHVQINRINSIRINCNITTGSFNNGAPAHIIHEFFPTVPPGYKIVEEPQHIIYLPINVRRIDYINLSITDQDGIPLNFRGDRISVRLHLKRWD